MAAWHKTSEFAPTVGSTVIAQLSEIDDEQPLLAVVVVSEMNLPFIENWHSMKELRRSLRAFQYRLQHAGQELPEDESETHSSEQ